MEPSTVLEFPVREISSFLNMSEMKESTLLALIRSNNKASGSKTGEMCDLCDSK